MEDYNQIPKTGTIGGMVDNINANFQLTKEMLERLEVTKDHAVGLFSTLANLQAAYPSPEVGDWALVGDTTPFAIYKCTTAGTWSDTGGTYDGGSIDLSDYVTKDEFNDALRGQASYVDVLPLVTTQNGTINKDTGAIKSNANYRILTIANNSYEAIKFTTAAFTGTVVLALYSTDAISADGYLSDYTILAANGSYKTYEVEIPSTCRLIAVVYGTAYAADGVTLFQALVRSGGLPEMQSDIEQLQSDINDINGEIYDVREEVQEAAQDNFLTELVTKQSGFVGRPADLTLTGFWTDGENGAKLSTTYAYHSMPLIAVQPGQLVEMTDWCINPVSASLAMCMFDADKMPYNGTKSRIDFYQFTTKDYATGHYAYTLPDNVYWLGISVKDSDTLGDNPKVTVGETGYTLTEEGVALVRSAGGGEGDTSAASKDNSALYYLKGTGADPSVVSTKKVCILAAGQSNIDGRNPHSELPSYVVTPNANIRYSKNNVNGTFVDFSVPTTDNGIDWAFDTIVYNALVDANHGGLDKIYVIKRSMGGTSIDPEGATDYHWTADYEQLDSESHSLLRLFERGIRAAIARDGEDFDIKAVLWHQGEGDDNTSQAVADRYQNNLRNVVAYIRGIVGKPNLPFICGSISENNTERWRADINQAIWNLAAEDANFYCVDMSGATLKDAWHFNSAASEYFGQKAYDILVDIGVVGGTKYNPTCPWTEKTTAPTTFNNVSGESVAKAMQVALNASSTSIDQTARDMASAAQTTASAAKDEIAKHGLVVDVIDTGSSAPVDSGSTTSTTGQMYFVSFNQTFYLKVGNNFYSLFPNYPHASLYTNDSDAIFYCGNVPYQFRWSDGEFAPLMGTTGVVANISRSITNDTIGSLMEVISRTDYEALTPTQQASKVYFIYED